MYLENNGSFKKLSFCTLAALHSTEIAPFILCTSTIPGGRPKYASCNFGTSTIPGGRTRMLIYCRANSVSRLWLPASPLPPAIHAVVCAPVLVLHRRPPYMAEEDRAMQKQLPRSANAVMAGCHRAAQRTKILIFRGVIKLQARMGTWSSYNPYFRPES